MKSKWAYILASPTLYHRIAAGRYITCREIRSPEVRMMILRVISFSADVCGNAQVLCSDSWQACYQPSFPSVSPRDLLACQERNSISFLAGRKWHPAGIRKRPFSQGFLRFPGNRAAHTVRILHGRNEAREISVSPRVSHAPCSISILPDSLCISACIRKRLFSQGFLRFPGNHAAAGLWFCPETQGFIRFFAFHSSRRLHLTRP